MGAHYTWYGVRVKENKGHNPGGPWIDAACPDSLPSPCPANRLFPQIAFPPSSMNVRLPGPPQLLCISSLCLLDPSACAYSTALWDDLAHLPGLPRLLSPWPANLSFFPSFCLGPEFMLSPALVLREIWSLCKTQICYSPSRSRPCSIKSGLSAQTTGSWETVPPRHAFLWAWLSHF